MDMLALLLSFFLGFVVGVFERKVDKLKVNKDTPRQVLQSFKGETQSDVITTVSDEDFEEEERKAGRR